MKISPKILSGTTGLFGAGLVLLWVVLTDDPSRGCQKMIIGASLGTVWAVTLVLLAWYRHSRSGVNPKASLFVMFGVFVTLAAILDYELVAASAMGAYALVLFAVLRTWEHRRESPVSWNDLK